MSVSECIYKCEYCDKEFKSKRSLRGHIVNNHFEKFETGIICKICGEKLYDKNCFRVHFGKNHKEINFLEYCKKNYKKLLQECKNCGKLVFKEYCDIKCHNRYKFNLKRMKNEKEYVYKCKLCGEKFKSNNWLRRHLHEVHTDISEIDYYFKYNWKEGDPKGNCLWCGKKVKFCGINNGFQKFCYNKDCNVNWYNKYKERHKIAAKNISKTLREGDKLPSQKRYWLKKGYNEEEAKQKVKERQQTNLVTNIQKRNKCSLEEAKRIRKEITKKWLKSFEKLNYSKISQNLFWELVKLKKLDLYNDVFFATNNKGIKDFSGKNNEFSVNTNNSYRKLDFYIKSLNKCIEFDGEYWHKIKFKNYSFSNTIDLKRDKEIKETISCEILHIKERDFKDNKEKVIQECLNFLEK